MIQLSIVTGPHIQTMKHKFETWKQIKSIASQIEFAPDEYNSGEDYVNTSKTEDLFYGNKSHDLGSILLTE